MKLFVASQPAAPAIEPRFIEGSNDMVISVCEVSAGTEGKGQGAQWAGGQIGHRLGGIPEAGSDSGQAVGGWRKAGDTRSERLARASCGRPSRSFLLLGHVLHGELRHRVRVAAADGDRRTIGGDPVASLTTLRWPLIWT